MTNASNRNEPGTAREDSYVHLPYRCRCHRRGALARQSPRCDLVATAAAVISIAKAELGYKESPAGSNSTKFNRWYYGSDVRAPWCAAFVSWVLDQAGVDGYRHVYTPSGVAIFKNAGRWHDGTAGIQAGDVAYFDFPDSVYRVQHVGFVTGPVKNGTIPTIEGNTSVTSDDNGGEVQARVRPISYVVGYGRPLYRKPPSTYVVTAKGKVQRDKFARLKERLQMLGLRITKKRRGRK